MTHKFKFGDMVRIHKDKDPWVVIGNQRPGTYLLRNGQDKQAEINARYIKLEDDGEIAWKEAALTAIRDRAQINGHRHFMELVGLLRELREIAILGRGPAPTMAEKI